MDYSLSPAFLITAAATAAKSLQSCPTVWPRRRQPTRFRIPGILQARTLEWVAIAFSAWLQHLQAIQVLKLQMKESFGPRKENNSLKGPLLNHLTSEKTKQNFSSTLMFQAGCIYLVLINPCPETFHPLHLPRRLIAPCPETLYPLHVPRRLTTLCPTTNVISTKEYSKYPAWLTFLLSLPQTSL